MYKLTGALGSPYSMKMRAVLRYRRIPHLWVHGADSRDALTKAKAPVIPVLEYPGGSFHNDSMPSIHDLAHFSIKRSRHRPAPPPGHPAGSSCGGRAGAGADPD